MKLSTATSVLVNYPLQTAIEQVVLAGFDGVDIWAGRPHLYRNDYSARDLVGLRRIMESSGLLPVSVMPAFYRYPYSLSSPVDTIRRDSIVYVKECMENAQQIGCTDVLIVPTHSLFGQSRDDAAARFADSLSELTLRAEILDMRLGIEILNPALSDIVHTTGQAMQFIREIGSMKLGVVLDSGHMCLSGEHLQEALAIAGDALFEIHINDNDGRVQQNAIPGEGVIDFAVWVNQLKSVSYDGFLTLELGAQYWPDPLAALDSAARKMRKLLEESVL